MHEPALTHPQLTVKHPAHRLFDARGVSYGRGSMEATQGAPSTVLDEHGRLPAGALCVVSDFVLGFSCATVQGEAQKLVTAQLTLDFAEVPGPSRPTVTAAGSCGHSDGRSALATGRLTLPDGALLAEMSSRFIIVAPDNLAGRHVQAEAGAAHEPPAEPVRNAAEPHPLLAGASVYDLLAARVLEAGAGRAKVELVVDPLFANERGGLHGGIGSLMTERAADLALRAALPAGTSHRLANLRVTFIRPIAALGQATLASGTVHHLGRTQALVRSELLTPAGKLALATDALFLLDP